MKNLWKKNYDTDMLTKYIENNEPRLQKQFLNKKKYILLDAPGRRGKTFLINLLLVKVQQRN